MPTLADSIAALVGADPQELRLHHATNHVRRISGARGSVLVKTFTSDRPYRQELRAYTEWRPHLPEQTAELLAADDESRALVFTFVEGAAPLTDTLSRQAECTAHWHAGRFLRALHDIPLPDPDPLPLADAIIKRYEAWRSRVTPHLAPAELTALTALAPTIPRLFADATRVWTHRDFTPRNWLARGSHDHTRSLTVVDFEHARPDTPLADFLKVAAELWPTRPDLEDSLLSGYGRDLTASERAQLQILVALHAMATLAWAHTHRDPTFLAAGRTALAAALA